MAYIDATLNYILNQLDYIMQKGVLTPCGETGVVADVISTPFTATTRFFRVGKLRFPSRRGRDRLVVPLQPLL